MKIAQMKTTRTIELTVERSSFFLRRNRADSAFAWCERCGIQVRLIRPEEASRFIGVSARSVYRRIEAGELHFTETAEGLVLVCLDSLSSEEVVRNTVEDK